MAILGPVPCYLRCSSQINSISISLGAFMRNAESQTHLRLSVSESAREQDLYYVYTEV